MKEPRAQLSQAESLPEQVRQGDRQERHCTPERKFPVVQVWQSVGLMQEMQVGGQAEQDPLPSST